MVAGLHGPRGHLAPKLVQQEKADVLEFATIHLQNTAAAIVLDYPPKLSIVMHRLPVQVQNRITQYQ